ncbi:MAG: stage 0 sporulation family protein, partial [Bacillota bacterium]|nr:stage 0 sporulation family protein [Bacillota bacterium]
MAQVVGIRFKTAGKVYYFDPGGLPLEPGDGAVVETARGIELGMVASWPKEVPDEEVKAPLKRVLRKAGPEDFARRRENEEKARRAFSVGQQKIAAHGLPMKLVHVEYTLDGSKIIFYFTAENRVDFRELVKDLASTFRTRIELRQIGVRDEAKLLGGLGPCGRQLCCQAFLGDFVPVSIRMAKEQNLSLNPTKISGICGRLMCCLNFESEAYREARKAAKAAQAEEAEAASPAPEAPEAPGAEGSADVAPGSGRAALRR